MVQGGGCQHNFQEEQNEPASFKEKEVALFNPAKTCSALPYMEEEFLQWLYKEAAEGKGGFDQQVVFKVLRKEEVDGETIISSRIKPGNFLETTFHVNFFRTGAEEQWTIRISRWRHLWKIRTGDRS